MLPFSTARDRPQWFLDVNPRGLVPLLKVGSEYYWDSTAILTFIGRSFGSGSWLPCDVSCLARVMQWLALAQSEILHGLVRVRHIQRGSRKGDVEEAKALGERALTTLESQLVTGLWLAGINPTIADIACYPHVSRMEESGYAIKKYPVIASWLRRIETLPRWVARLQGSDSPIDAQVHEGRPWR
jgi:glutathione S-transferase